MPPHAPNHGSTHVVKASQKVKQFFGISRNKSDLVDKHDQTTDLLCFQGDRQEFGYCIESGLTCLPSVPLSDHQ
ncbi:hypothetical protein H257_18631 [Aphanomyces astaci]|uniref:Uncharacterized protein n=1 Tax=Aphanomyces astaci TaxID=112090 RepID=W4FAK4_APHAT|nr:hypothetical protein H257_18631 [Aphanomyces astaci]ETV64487.1 hypothetical protein H257_18631 [Aphanomyces astaci]|eukprot:XP_009846027.1 hypothetical protein H257_18631 [Aphanomyces astaci]